MSCCWLVETRSQLRKQHIVTDNFEELEVGKIKRQAPLLAESDVRYAGRRVSRKDIEEHISAAGILSLCTMMVVEFHVQKMTWFAT